MTSERRPDDETEIPPPADDSDELEDLDEVGDPEEAPPPGPKAPAD